MKIADASPYRIAELWTSVESQVQRSSYLEQASQELATAIHEQFAESVGTTQPEPDTPRGAQTMV